MLEGYAYCKMLFEDGEAQDFIYLDVNQAFETLTGLKNVIGKKVSEVIPGLRESNQELLDVYGRVAQTGNPEKLETYVEPLGIWFSVSVYSTERDHFVAVFDNITERKHAEELHRQAEHRYRSLFEDAPLMYVITRNKQGVPFVSDCNELFLSSVGYSREEIVGQPLGGLLLTRVTRGTARTWRVRTGPGRRILHRRTTTADARRQTHPDSLVYRD